MLKLMQCQASFSALPIAAIQDLLTTEPDLAAGFQNTQFLVMDEADRLLEPSFEPDLRAILTKLPAKRQTLLFSATMTKNLIALQKAVLHDAYHFQVSRLLRLHSRGPPSLPCITFLQHKLSGFITSTHSAGAREAML